VRSNIALPSAQPFTVISADSVGYVDSNNPTQTADTGGLEARAEAAWIFPARTFRGFCQFATPFEKFRAFAAGVSTLISPGGFGLGNPDPHVYKSNACVIEWITTPNLDLTTINWSNQGTLTYETIAAQGDVFDFYYTGSVATSGASTLESYSMPLGKYSAPSGNPITGFRLTIKNETPPNDFGAWSARLSVPRIYV
jgi:hypothetical protein